MNDFYSLTLLVIVVFAGSMTGVIAVGLETDYNQAEIDLLKEEIIKIKQSMNEMVRDGNTANERQNNNIETLCNGIEGCEYGG